MGSVGNAEVKGAGEFTERAAFTRIASVGLGDVRLRDQLFAVVPLEKLGEVEGVPFHGILGYELFKRFVVRIDYAGRTMTLYDVTAWRAEGAGVAVPFVFNGTVPEVEGEIGGVAATFDVDTGSRASVGLNSPFVQKHALRARFKPSIDAVTGWALGGPTRGTVARVNRVRLGSVSVPDVIVDMSLQRLGALTNTAPAGSIGSGLLQRFVATFDYSRQRIYLLAAPGARVRDAYDRSGLWINQGAGGFRVDAVVEGSPAARVGLRDGDIIVGDRWSARRDVVAQRRARSSARRLAGDGCAADGAKRRCGARGCDHAARFDLSDLRNARSRLRCHSRLMAALRVLWGSA